MNNGNNEAMTRLLSAANAGNSESTITLRDKHDLARLVATTWKLASQGESRLADVDTVYALISGGPATLTLQEALKVVGTSRVYSNFSLAGYTISPALVESLWKILNGGRTEGLVDIEDPTIKTQIRNMIEVARGYESFTEQAASITSYVVSQNLFGQEGLSGIMAVLLAQLVCFTRARKMFLAVDSDTPLFLWDTVCNQDWLEARLMEVVV